MGVLAEECLLKPFLPGGRLTDRKAKKRLDDPLGVSLQSSSDEASGGKNIVVSRIGIYNWRMGNFDPAASFPFNNGLRS